MYNQLMLSLDATVFLPSCRRSKILAIVEGVHLLRWLKYSLKPSGAYVKASEAAA